MTNKYQRPFYLFNGHLETIFPALLRKIQPLGKLTEQRIDTPDGDFLDLMWMKQGSKKLIILQHGLEGNGQKAYIMGMANLFFQNGYDTLSWNFRGCGKELNKKPIFYHSGATYDLNTVVKTATQHYNDITLAGFSLGGNLTLKYVGEPNLPQQIKRAVAVSVPLNLHEGSDNLSLPKCYIYEKRFLNNLIKKVKRKKKIQPNLLTHLNLQEIKSLKDFDNKVTAPLHGYSSAIEYYEANSSKYFLDNIKIPTLIINALNDPMLSEDTLRTDIHSNPNVRYILSEHGGHVGFASGCSKKPYWSEELALKFCMENS